MEPIQQFLATRAFIVKDGKVLIIRESKNYVEKRKGTEQKYDFPGGKIKPGEKYQEATIREVKEECGLDVTVGKPFFMEEWRPVIKDKQIQIIGVFLLCQPTSDTVTMSEDHDSYEWIDPKDYKKYVHLWPNDLAFEAYLNTK